MRLKSSNWTDLQKKACLSWPGIWQDHGHRDQSCSHLLEGNKPPPSPQWWDPEPHSMICSPNLRNVPGVRCLHLSQWSHLMGGKRNYSISCWVSFLFICCKTEFTNHPCKKDTQKIRDVLSVSASIKLRGSHMKFISTFSSAATHTVNTRSAVERIVAVYHSLATDSLAANKLTPFYTSLVMSEKVQRAEVSVPQPSANQRTRYQ